MGTEKSVDWRTTELPTVAVVEPSAGKPRAKPLRLSSERLQAWGWLSMLSLVDQGLTSGASFGVNLLLARWMAPNVYGAFAVAFAGFLFVSGFHNVLLLEPMSVMGPSRYTDKLPAYFRAQIVGHLVLVGPLSAMLLFGDLILWRTDPSSPLVSAVLAAALALPFLLLAWMVRRMCYIVQRPVAAALGSGFYFVFVAMGLFGLGYYNRLGPFTAFGLMGTGSVISAWLVLFRLGLLKPEPYSGDGVSWRKVLRENWDYGRWLVGSTLLFSVSSQTQTFLVAGFLGLTGAGILRALQLPALVMMQIVTAASLLALPSFALEYDHSRLDRLVAKLRILSLLLGGIGFAYVMLLFVAAGPLEHHLYAGRFGGYENLMCLLAISPFLMGINAGPTLSIRAIQRPNLDLLVNLIAAPVGLISGLIFIPKWGIWGAAGSSALTSLAILVGNSAFLRRAIAHRTPSADGSSQ